jgi:hypothetical protein
MIGLSACNRSGGSAFERECRAVQISWSGEANLIQTSNPRLAGTAMEAAWEYAFPGGKDAAIKTFQARVPAGYSAVRETSSELEFARFDGHDSFHLTVSFNSPRQDSTTVAVLLKSFPD